MISLENLQRLLSGNKLLGGRPSVDHALANSVLMRRTTGDPELLAAFKRQARELAEKCYSQRVGVVSFNEILNFDRKIS